MLINLLKSRHPDNFSERIKPLYLYRLPGSAVITIILLMKQTPKFFVIVRAKPYVRRFLEINYNYPVSFVGDPAAHRFLQGLLSKPNKSEDYKYSDNICTYTEEVEIVISEHDFYRYGFELTHTDTVAFGRFFEDRAKTLMRNMVGMYAGLGTPINKSIEKFQDRFGFNEDTWSYQTIKKDFYRNGLLHRIDFDVEIFKKMEKIILRNLYNLGTVSATMIKEYENNIETG